MRITPLLTSLVLTLALPESPSAFGQELPSRIPIRMLSAQDEIDDYVRREMDSQHIPGLALAVVRAGKIVQTKSYGRANLELEAPVTASTLFGLGSISKQFTAAAIMLLVEDQKLRIDDPISKYFSWMSNQWGGVTIRHLLTHTSGIREEEWKGGLVEFDRFEYEQEDVVRTAFGPLLSPPGARFEYRNVGYRLLGMLIEKASGQAYWDFLAQRIFRPLGMNSTRNSDPKTVIPSRARGYAWSEGRWVNREPVTASSAFSEGALVSSTLDMVKWDIALNSETLLRRESLEAMWAPFQLNDGTLSKYGFGWFLRPIDGHRTVGHGGGLPGFSTFIWRFIDDQITVIVLTNSETADTIQIALHVAGLHVPTLLSPSIKKQL